MSVIENVRLAIMFFLLQGSKAGLTCPLIGLTYEHPRPHEMGVQVTLVAGARSHITLINKNPRTLIRPA
jgi:hypothetical protein